MKLDWEYDFCVGCLRRFDDSSVIRSSAHVIPRALGGRLELTCLCKRCNNLIGTRYEDQLPLNPPHRDEIERFASVVPRLALQLRKAGRRYIALTEDGPLKMRRGRDGVFRVVDTELVSGRFKDTRDAASELRQRLEKAKAEPTEVDAVMEAFGRGEEVQVGEYTFRPRTGELQPQPDYDTYICPDEAYLSIAYLWLACVMEKFIAVRELAGVRTALVGAQLERDRSWTVERLHIARDSAPWHRLAITNTKPLVVEITLFGRWLYRVTFNEVNWPREAYGYRVDLPSGDEEVRQLPWVTEPADDPGTPDPAS